MKFKHFNDSVPPMFQDSLTEISGLARVPEHSLPLMLAMSGGKPFLVGPYLFLAADDWLMAIAYPLRGKYGTLAFSEALANAVQATGATACFAIGPELPPSLAANIVERDAFYILSAQAVIPGRLRNQARRAARVLAVSEGTAFTPGHRRLWSEFMERNAGVMSARVAGLYAKTPAALGSAAGNLRLLDARDANGRLVASLLLDYAPARFTSYILGAHSREFYVPHAADLLFAAMLERARAAGKRFIHLGLGVNDGILRFKRKWGAKKYFPYVMAQWEEAPAARARPWETPGEENVGRALAMALMRSPGVSARQALGETPSRKPFAMLWRIEKKGRVSWLGGTAHFFCHSFEPSFRKLFRNVDTVIFEGPLDADFMARVDKAGKTLPQGSKPLIDLMSQEEIVRLERVVHGPSGPLARLLGMESRRRTDVRWLLRNARPWCAFFSLWTAFLERKGWHESVDMEAWRIARDMRKTVIGMENLEEQLESLGSLPVERVLRFFRACGGWKTQAARNMHAYLAGDLEKMMGSSAEFPTRTEHVVGRRDQRFRERMRPYLEAGRAAVFVGSAHMVNLRHMLVEDGFKVRQSPFGILPKLWLGWRRLARPDEKVRW